MRYDITSYFLSGRVITGKIKIAITINQTLLSELDRLVKQRVFPNRSKAIEEAVQDKINRMKLSRLATECAKLDPKFE